MTTDIEVERHVADWLEEGPLEAGWLGGRRRHPDGRRDTARPEPDLRESHDALDLGRRGRRGRCHCRRRHPPVLDNRTGRRLVVIAAAIGGAVTLGRC